MLLLEVLIWWDPLSLSEVACLSCFVNTHDCSQCDVIVILWALGRGTMGIPLLALYNKLLLLMGL